MGEERRGWERKGWERRGEGRRGEGGRGEGERGEGGRGEGGRVSNLTMLPISLSSSLPSSLSLSLPPCRLVALIEEENSGTDLISEAVITLGSFAHGRTVLGHFTSSTVDIERIEGLCLQ